jgi:hypothetical protein
MRSQAELMYWISLPTRSQRISCMLSVIRRSRRSLPVRAAAVRWRSVTSRVMTMISAATCGATAGTCRATASSQS